MSLNNGIISAPVSIDDVKSVLGEGSNDLATLCKSTNINMWSRHKPVIHPSLFDENAIVGTDGNFGFNIPKFTSVKALYENYMKYANEDGLYPGDEGWNIPTNGVTYVHPTGGSSSPYRLGDFKSYDKNATCLMHDFDINTYTDEELSFIISIDKDSGGTQIPFRDIATYKNCYFGVAFLRDDSLAIHSILTSNNKNDNFLKTTFVYQNLVNLLYIAVPFMSPIPHLKNAPNLETSDSIECYPIVGVSPILFYGKNDTGDYIKYMYFVYPDRDSNGNECIRIYNKSTVLNVGYVLYLLYADSSYYNGYTLKDGEYRVDTGYISAKSNVVTYLNNDWLIKGKSYKLVLYSTNNNKIAQEMEL